MPVQYSILASINACAAPHLLDASHGLHAGLDQLCGAVYGTLCDTRHRRSRCKYERGWLLARRGKHSLEFLEAAKQDRVEHQRAR